MSKREARTFAAAGVDVDAPRAKRRRDAPATTSTSPNGKHAADATHSNGGANGDGESGGTGESRDVVREKGLQVWQSLQDAVNKEGQIASFQFMRLPSKRQYPDYYQQIKRPIALEDIRAKLETREYASLEDFKQDIETCFRNAKRYNMKESQIWKDAKFLHKLAMKEYSRVTGTKEEAPGDDGEEKAGSEDDGGAKKKTPNLHRLLKTRLQKLVDKADDKGRILSAEFMELPSRKQWPMYYQIIKKPQALENVFKKLKRKEYHNPTDFANDVELVFSNALEFNQEHTQIWEDAVTLREYFRKLLADLPEPYSIPAYATAGDHPTKIKLKMPAAPTQPIAAPTPTLPSSNKINVHGHHATSSRVVQPAPKPQPASATASSVPTRPSTAVKSPPVTPALPPTPAPAPVAPKQSPATLAPAIAPTPSAPPKVPHTPKLKQTGALPAVMPQTSTPASYYPNAVYHQPIAPAAPKAPAPSTSSGAPYNAVTPATPVPAPHPIPVAATSRPSPPTPNQHLHPLNYAVVTAMPLGRRLVLHHDEGVRTWAMRLSGAETSVILSNITFLHQGDDGDESSGDEEHDQEEGSSPSRGKRRGRPPKKRARTTESAKKGKAKAAEPSPGGVQVKLNGGVLQGKEGGIWEVLLPFGVSVLELGEKGGMVWKVYLDRAAY
ncbi:Bromodomain-containing protein [Trametes elegans]|nr:Bromodomain-containing protein [Trametes elegans]